MISVCLASYNGEEFLAKQLESILSQLGETDEVIVSDDASSDKTGSIALSFNDRRIKLLHHDPCGFPYNFENALKEANGDYVFLSDQDDVWAPRRVARVMEVFEKGCDLVDVDAKLIDASGTFVGDSFFKLNGTRKGIVANLMKNSFLGCCMAFRRELLDEAMPFPRHLYMHDWWIALIAMVYGYKYEYVHEPLHYYRKHGGNLTDGGNKSRNPYWLRIWRRLILVSQLVMRRLSVRRLKK